MRFQASLTNGSSSCRKVALPGGQERALLGRGQVIGSILYMLHQRHRQSPDPQPLDRRARSSEGSLGCGSVESPVSKTEVKPSEQRSGPRKGVWMRREKAHYRAWPRKAGHNNEAVKSQKKLENWRRITSWKPRRISRVRMEGVIKRYSGIKHGKCHFV